MRKSSFSKTNIKMKNVLLFIALLFCLCTQLSYAEDLNVKIDSINPAVGFPCDTVTILGSGFGISPDTSFVKFKSAGKEYNAEIKGWTDKKIIAIVPSVAEKEKEVVKVTVLNKDKSSAPIEFEVYSNKLIEEAILLKKGGVSDSTIVDHLYYLGLSENDEVHATKCVFGNTRLTGYEISRLKSAGFQDDFIAKTEGHPQNVTLGVAAIWLNRTAVLVGAPMLRVFLVPRSYFKKRRDYWGTCWWGMCWKYPSLPVGLIDHERWDLNFGLTTVTSTTSDGTGEKRSYVLVGLSHELNLSALLNIGWALVPGDIKGTDKQFYFGITVDYNLLKSLGVVSK